MVDSRGQARFSVFAEIVERAAGGAGPATPRKLSLAIERHASRLLVHPDPPTRSRGACIRFNPCRDPVVHSRKVIRSCYIMRASGNPIRSRTMWQQLDRVVWVQSSASYDGKKRVPGLTPRSPRNEGKREADPSACLVVTTPSTGVGPVVCVLRRAKTVYRA